ncbi:rhodanese-like domain-containing protein [Roseateles violae]|uniref:Rhodanese-like domain-containing protein n=1 Tax=Roseateles violae TaxID=3058042 RepID=A0ABT8DPJ7_9BURK|nr:rhodanese-like domain-containing protein [Pelomonas sp. PFR6]MDN3920277.1 rhodanese-like domain-containing protein [Pelomonas sp. PFR6]
MRQIGAAELRRLCEGAQAPLLLDVREPWEAQLASIRLDGVAARLLPMGELAGRLDELDPLQPVVVYCHHGMRSLQVVAFLQRQGFESVYNLAGGIDAWSLEVDASVPRY